MPCSNRHSPACPACFNPNSVQNRLTAIKTTKNGKIKLAKNKKHDILREVDRDIAQLGLARLTGGQKVESSNLSIPTICSVYGILDTTFESC